MKTTTSSVFNNTTNTFATTESLPSSGYDLPVFGLDNGQFLSVHVPAIICTFLSFTCALLVLAFSFHNNGKKSFFRWNKGERFVVYMELCDAALTLGSAMSRVYILSTSEHVHPPWFCIMNAFITEFSKLSQTMMVNAIAVNAFFLMYRGHDLKFGPYDFRLLLYSFGTAIVILIYFAASHQLGPNGTVCGLDRVNNTSARIITNTMQMTVVISNTILYILTWYKIDKEAREMRKILKEQSTSKGAVTRTAKTMTLLVLAYFIQWFPGVIFSFYILMSSTAPMFLVKCVASFSNLGGILNGGVYLIVRWKKLRPSKNEQPPETSSTRV